MFRSDDNGTMQSFVAAGLACAVALGRVAESVLFGLVGYDLRVLAAATVVLGIVVTAAGYLPARHASRVDRG